MTCTVSVPWSCLPIDTHAHSYFGTYEISGFFFFCKMYTFVAVV